MNHWHMQQHKVSITLCWLKKARDERAHTLILYVYSLTWNLEQAKLIYGDIKQVSTLSKLNKGKEDWQQMDMRKLFGVTGILYILIQVIAAWVYIFSNTYRSHKIFYIVYISITLILKEKTKNVIIIYIPTTQFCYNFF